MTNWYDWWMGWFAGIFCTAILFGGIYLYITKYLKGLIVIWLPSY